MLDVRTELDGSTQDWPRALNFPGRIPSSLEHEASRILDERVRSSKSEPSIPVKREESPNSELIVLVKDESSRSAETSAPSEAIGF